MAWPCLQKKNNGMAMLKEVSTEHAKIESKVESNLNILNGSILMILG